MNNSIFSDWHDSNREVLSKLRGKQVAVTFSAGKDSSVCQYFLNEVRDQYGFNLRAFLCAYPRHRYNEKTISRLKDYWEKRNVDMTVQIPENDDGIMEAADNPCRPCQNERKSALPGIFSYFDQPASEIVIVSGHSLWDIAAYAANRMIADKLASVSSGETRSKERLLEISQRFYPFFTMPEGYSVYRPLLKTNQKEIHQFCSEKSIPVIEEECRYSTWRPKNRLSDFFEKFGYDFNYETVFSFAQEQLNIIPLETITSIDSREYLSRHF